MRLKNRHGNAVGGILAALFFCASIVLLFLYIDSQKQLTLLQEQLRNTSSSLSDSTEILGQYRSASDVIQTLELTFRANFSASTDPGAVADTMQADKPDVVLGADLILNGRNLPLVSTETSFGSDLSPDWRTQAIHLVPAKSQNLGTLRDYAAASQFVVNFAEPLNLAGIRISDDSTGVSLEVRINGVVVVATSHLSPCEGTLSVGQATYCVAQPFAGLMHNYLAAFTTRSRR